MIPGYNTRKPRFKFFSDLLEKQLHAEANMVLK